MPLNTIIYSLLLIILGVGTYILAPADHRSPTALIPAFAGAVFFLLGAASMAKDSLRKHLMHAAAALALLCILFPGGRAIVALAKVSFDFSQVNRMAIIAQLLMAAFSAVYLILCIRSFKAARKARLAAR